MSQKKHVLVVFGTRPEAIKMGPVVKELAKYPRHFQVTVCVTAQHREMLDQVLEIFKIVPDIDLSIMKPNQSLFDLTARILRKMEQVIKDEKPDLVLVHGDTTTSYVAALAAFYEKIPIGHVEAGLRTGDLYSPFPEEFNRKSVSLIAKYHFAPTEISKQNLMREGYSEESIYVTGNTAIDALKYTVKKNYSHPLLKWVRDSKLIMITAHRRENLGQPMRNMFKAIKRVLIENEAIKAIYPVHLNPKVQQIADEVFGEMSQVKLIEPLNVTDFHNFLNHAYLILTDSGGIQEEAPSLGKPVLVMRDTTERPEGIKAGTLKLVGTDEEPIYTHIKLLIQNQSLYTKMSRSQNPYGDGKASQRIVQILKDNI